MDGVYSLIDVNDALRDLDEAAAIASSEPGFECNLAPLFEKTAALVRHFGVVTSSEKLVVDLARVYLGLGTW